MTNPSPNISTTDHWPCPRPPLTPNPSICTDAQKITRSTWLVPLEMIWELREASFNCGSKTWRGIVSILMSIYDKVGNLRRRTYLRRTTIWACFSAFMSNCLHFWASSWSRWSARSALDHLKVVALVASVVCINVLAHFDRCCVEEFVEPVVEMSTWPSSRTGISNGKQWQW